MLDHAGAVVVDGEECVGGTLRHLGAGKTRIKADEQRNAGTPEQAGYAQCQLGNLPRLVLPARRPRAGDRSNDDTPFLLFPDST